MMPVLIAVLFVTSAIGISVGFSATKKKNLAEAKAQELRQQLIALQNGEKPIEPLPEIEPLKITSSAASDTNGLMALQDQQGELERLRAELEAAKKNQRQPRVSFAERLEKMKQDDPEGYAEAMQRREEFQQKMKYDMAERAALLVDVDTSGMNEEELAVHNELVERMGRVFELTEMMQNPEGGMSRETMGELFNNIREARPLMEQERSVILRDMGQDLGMNQQESQNMAAYIESVISATTVQMPHGGGRGGSGGGRGGPGGGRGGPGGGGQ